MRGVQHGGAVKRRADFFYPKVSMFFSRPVQSYFRINTGLRPFDICLRRPYIFYTYIFPLFAGLKKLAVPKKYLKGPKTPGTAPDAAFNNPVTTTSKFVCINIEFGYNGKFFADREKSKGAET